MTIIEQREVLMAVSLKPSQIDVQNKLYEKNNYLRLELEKIKFAPLSDLNQLKKLIIYHALLSSQGKLVDNKTIFAQFHAAMLGAINKLHEKIASNPEEHATKLQESYMTLKMQPRYSGESDDEFQERLSQHANKANPTVSSEKEDSGLTYNQDSYLYLSKYASFPRINPAYAQNNQDLETEQAAMRLTK